MITKQAIIAILLGELYSIYCILDNNREGKKGKMKKVKLVNSAQRTRVMIQYFGDINLEEKNVGRKIRLVSFVDK